MTLRGILTLPAMTMLGLVLLQGSAVSQQKSLKDQIVGTWSIVSWERTASDGTKVHSFGTNPKGVNVFGADGRFIVFYARGDLPQLAANDRLKSTPQEAKAIVDGSIAYQGTYTIDEASKTITLNLESSTFPNQLGRPHKRTIVSLTADELSYSNPTAMAGGQILVTFKRAPGAATN
jgi:hypothetical protein